jgi:hypothetical protein
MNNKYRNGRKFSETNTEINLRERIAFKEIYTYI